MGQVVAPVWEVDLKDGSCFWTRWQCSRQAKGGGIRDDRRGGVAQYPSQVTEKEVEEEGQVEAGCLEGKLRRNWHRGRKPGMWDPARDAAAQLC